MITVKGLTIMVEEVEIVDMIHIVETTKDIEVENSVDVMNEVGMIIIEVVGIMSLVII
jgi:hypothetical protein